MAFSGILFYSQRVPVETRQPWLDMPLHFKKVIPQQLKLLTLRKWEHKWLKNVKSSREIRRNMKIILEYTSDGSGLGVRCQASGVRTNRNQFHNNLQVPSTYSYLAVSCRWSSPDLCYKYFVFVYTLSTVQWLPQLSRIWGISDFKTFHTDWTSWL